MYCKLFIQQESLGTILIGPFAKEEAEEEKETSFV
jgi:hypothetical protein